jgi:hypothetical protein
MPLVRREATRRCPAQKGAQYQDTFGRGCEWYATPSSCHSRYHGGLQTGCGVDALRRGRPASKCAVGTDFNIISNPSCRQNLRLIHVAKQFTVQELIPHTSVDIFAVVIFSWAARLNVGGNNAQFCQPLAQFRCNQLATIVTAQIFRRPMHQHCGHAPAFPCARTQSRYRSVRAETVRGITAHPTWWSTYQIRR